MAYVAMARKWRPKSFDDLVGQEHIARTITNAIESGRLHHAFLFTGTRGVGKTTSARILARTLNCTGEGKRPCGKCRACLEVDDGSSLDVIEMDGASNSGVDDVRAVIEQVKYAPMNRKYRVIVIDEVHMLTKNACNALLKTLEEPPPHIIFIMATTEVNKVPQTILSRVLRFDFRRISPENVAARLKHICGQENIPADDDALRAIAEKADGSMRDALTYFDQVYAFRGDGTIDLESVHEALGIPPEELFSELAKSIAAHDAKGCVETVVRFHRKGIEIPDFLEGLLRHLRNLLLASIGDMPAEEIGVSPEALRELREQAVPFTTGDLLRLARIALDLRQEVRWSADPRVTVEIGLLRMAHLASTRSIRKLLEAQTEKKN